MKSISRHKFTATRPPARRATVLVGFFLGLGACVQAAIFTVTTTADSGAGSLRTALESANAAAGLDEIRFNLPGPAPFTITPLSPLPEVTDPVLLDGTGQPGFAGTPVIVLDGSSAGGGTSGLIISAGGSTVRGLVIQRFGYAGVWLAGGSGHLVAGNYLGLSASGTQDLGNNSYGILVGCPANQIGGPAAGARNVISGNGLTGIYLYNGSAANNVIEGNYLGTNASGQAAIGNHLSGITILAGIGNRVGGTVAGTGNLLSGNGEVGLQIGGTATGTVVQGNYVGTDATGQFAVANSLDGIEITEASGNFIGGSAPGAGNLVSGNLQAGISIHEPAASGNVVRGNRIGTQADGVGALGNRRHGVYVFYSAHDNVIGGLGGGEGNLITHNCTESSIYDGVRIHLTAGLGNRVSGNSIFANNSSLDIDLGADGVSPNSAANAFPQFPVLTCAALRGGRAAIYGTLSGPANQTFTLEIFSNAAANPTGYGAAQRLNGTTLVTTDAAGVAKFAVTCPAASLAGARLSATTTNAAQTTSELAPAILSSAADTDLDGLPNVFETAFQLDPNDPADAARDPDGDGVGNLQELLAGTNPKDARSILRINALEHDTGLPAILFSSVAGLHYRLETAASLLLPWQTAVADIPGTGATIRATDPTWSGAGQAFYRVTVLP